ncbi:Methionine aminopeptidase [Candidatus Purcelliella pentastirinorum]|uniref:Methionine aminopeptidase n=1 Tax=Candidatus Purcelliella pentastirinorum TaxID=472834 RepID=A0A346DZE3_9ENTR|nr:type I methionyl aminopeptidase [Candidatus Purcelliella pentastirinorum]AXN02098.1 Methionine aminopeptidase [Candidatus Purcelliella pentastirinorum]
MKINIKNKKEIKKMRKVGKLAAEILDMIEKYVKPGITTEELDNICKNYIKYTQKAKSACLGYHGFPKSICTSINDTVCHGIPNKTTLKSGDIINIDVSIIKNEYHSDTSKMFFVGKIKKKNEYLCKIAKKSLYNALKIIKPNIYIEDIGYNIQKYVESKKFTIVREYCGHGIGRKFHEQPQVLHYKTTNNQIKLKPGMIFTIEPMINMGTEKTKIMQDGWTVKTKDSNLSAQYEHTILVTNFGCEILTLNKSDNIKSKLINI